MDTPNVKAGPFALETSRLGGVPVVNHFWDRLRLDAVLARWMPTRDRRCLLDPVVAIRLVVVNLLVGRRPLYALGEWAAPFAPHLLGLPDGDTGWLNDDRIGRALDRLFDADRASLMTDLVVGAIAEFGVDTSEMHNDSTSVSVYGDYVQADGSKRRGKDTTKITHGHSIMRSVKVSSRSVSHVGPRTENATCLTASTFSGCRLTFSCRRARRRLG